MSLLPAPKKIASFHPPLRTLMGPGPSEMHPRTIAALGQPVVGYLDPIFVGMIRVRAGNRLILRQGGGHGRPNEC